MAEVGTGVHYDRCPACKRLVSGAWNADLKLWTCSRCGRPFPPEITKEEALKTLRTILEKDDRAI